MVAGQHSSRQIVVAEFSKANNVFFFLTFGVLFIVLVIVLLGWLAGQQHSSGQIVVAEGKEWKEGGDFSSQLFRSGLNIWSWIAGLNIWICWSKYLDLDCCWSKYLDLDCSWSKYMELECCLNIWSCSAAGLDIWIWIAAGPNMWS